MSRDADRGQRWRGRTLGLGLAGVAVVAGWLLWGGAKEPKLEGRRLSEWARDLATPDPRIQSRAKRVLAAAGPAMVPWLERELQSRESWVRRPFEAWGGRIPVRFRGWIGRTFRPYEASLRRQGAVRALMGYGTNVTAEVFVGALRDQDAHVVMASGEALRALGVAAVPALRAGLRDPNERVRSVCCGSLSGLGAAAAPAAPELMALLMDPAGNIPAQAAQALTQTGPAALPTLLPVALDPSDRRWGRVLSILESIGRLTPEAVEALIPLLTSADAEVRWRVCAAMVRLAPKSERVAAALGDRLEDALAPVRAAAAAALATCGRRAEPVLPRLKARQDDPDPQVRSNVVAALRRLQRLTAPR